MPEFQFLSDIHLECNPCESIQSILDPVAPYLVLAGDIAKITTPCLPVFLKSCVDNFKKVIVVLGNHDYYGFTFEDVDEWWARISKFYPSIVVLNNAMMELDGILIVGTPFWCNIPSTMRFRLPLFRKALSEDRLRRVSSSSSSLVRRVLPPHVDTIVSQSWHPSYKKMPRQIRITHDEFSWIHMICRHVVHNAVMEAKRKNVPLLVITHYPPVYDVLHPKYLDSGRLLDDVSRYYASDYKEDVKKWGVHTWMFGHTAYNGTWKIGDTRLVTNQHENTNDDVLFERQYVVKIE
jgi:predicted phosphohydrolase